MMSKNLQNEPNQFGIITIDQVTILIFCCHDFEETRYLDMARNATVYAVLVRDTDFTNVHAI